MQLADAPAFVCGRIGVALLFVFNGAQYASSIDSSSCMTLREYWGCSEVSTTIDRKLGIQYKP